MHDRDGRLKNDSLYYRVWDTASPRAHAFISHGYAEHGGRYDHVARALNEAGLTVWAIDHRGHGNSEGERGDIGGWDSAAADFDLLVDAAVAEAGDLPRFLIGHSLGGGIAVAYTLAHQDRLSGVSLSGPAIVFPPEVIELLDQPEPPADFSLADAISSDPAVVQAYKDDPLVYLGPPPRGMIDAMKSAHTLAERLPEITIPVQVMHGSTDLLVPVDAFKAVVAGVSSTDVFARLWPGLFHEIFNEATDGKVVGTLVDWIAERL